MQVGCCRRGVVCSKISSIAHDDGQKAVVQNQWNGKTEKWQGMILAMNKPLMVSDNKGSDCLLKIPFKYFVE